MLRRGGAGDQTRAEQCQSEQGSSGGRKVGTLCSWDNSQTFGTFCL